MDKKAISQVIIVGGGPVGLWLAAELQSGGLKVTVLEARRTRDPRSRAAAMAAGTLETFASRGVEKRFLEAGIPIHSVHFGGSSTRLQFASALGTKYPFSLMIPQATTEQIMTAYCQELGVNILFDHRVDELLQTDESVKLTTSSEDGFRTSFEASWVVGCDGTRSNVRKLAEIDFPGTESDVTGWLADVILITPPAGPVIIRNSHGSCLCQELGDGQHHRFAGLDFATQHLAPSETPTLQMIRSWVSSAFGTDFGLHSPLWISRFGNATRLASSFRAKRVFVAGDAAHQFFPAGGQGINTGLQDAANLAWKLVSVANVWLSGPEAEQLLNSYDHERRLAVQAVMKSTNAQTLLFAARLPREDAMSDVVSELLALPEANAIWARRVTGFGDPFPDSQGEHDKLIGARVTHLHVDSSWDKLHSAMSISSFIVVSVKASMEPILKKATIAWERRLEYLGGTEKVNAFGEQWQGVVALLIRPDARIAWIQRESHQTEEAVMRLTQVLQISCIQVSELSQHIGIEV